MQAPSPRVRCEVLLELIECGLVQPGREHPPGGADVNRGGYLDTTISLCREAGQALAGLFHGEDGRRLAASGTGKRCLRVSSTRANSSNGRMTPTGLPAASVMNWRLKTVPAMVHLHCLSRALDAASVARFSIAVDALRGLSSPKGWGRSASRWRDCRGQRRTSRNRAGRCRAPRIRWTYA